MLVALFGFSYVVERGNLGQTVYNSICVMGGFMQITFQEHLSISWESPYLKATFYLDLASSISVWGKGRQLHIKYSNQINYIYVNVEKGEQKERFAFIQNKIMQHEQKHPHEINQRKDLQFWCWNSQNTSLCQMHSLHCSRVMLFSQSVHIGWGRQVNNSEPCTEKSENNLLLKGFALQQQLIKGWKKSGGANSGSHAQINQAQKQTFFVSQSIQRENQFSKKYVPFI